MNEHAPTNKPAHRSISGRWVVLLTLSLFLIVPVVSYLAWAMTQGEPARVSLDYTNRARWFMQPVKPRPLTYNTFVAAETGKQYKKTDLHLLPDVELVLQRCVRLAKSPTFFKDDASRAVLEPFAAEPANGFYPAYLLASWYQINGQGDESEQWMQAAYERAGGALAQRLLDEKRQAIPGYRLEPVAIGYDRIINGKRDATLVLVYPAPVSDADGFVYLPTFRSVYRLTDPDQAIGSDATLHPIALTLLPQPLLGEQPNWFAVPDGAVGRLPDAVIDDAP